MEELLIRSARESDRVGEVHDLAFASLGEGKLVTLLRASPAFVPELSLVAELPDRIAGHALFSRIQLTGPRRDLRGLALAPVAVLPGLQSRGIGGRLIGEGIRRARELGFDAVLVLGDPRYYARFGFRRELAARVRCRYAGPDFAGLELMPGALEGWEGSAVYPDAFSEVD